MLFGCLLSIFIYRSSRKKKEIALIFPLLFDKPLETKFESRLEEAEKLGQFFFQPSSKLSYTLNFALISANKKIINCQSNGKGLWCVLKRKSYVCVCSVCIFVICVSIRNSDQCETRCIYLAIGSFLAFYSLISLNLCVFVSKTLITSTT